MPNPAAPTNFIVSHIGLDHTPSIVNKPALRFAFTNNQPGATHLVQKSTNGTSGWKDLVEAGDGQTTVEAHNFAAVGAKFHFRIRAEFAAQGTFSAWVPLTGDPVITLPKIPTAAVQINAPSNLAIAQNDYRGVMLTWTDNADNESLHILTLTGPGLPAGGLEIPIDHLEAGSFSMPLGFPFSAGYQLQNAKTYTASVRARGGKQTTAKLTFDTDSTADVSFTTAASHVAIVNLPGTQVVPRGEVFSFRVLANLPATFSIVSGALPAGLALAADTISGNTTAAAGTYTLGLKADDGATSDSQILTLNVQTPAFNFTNLPGAPTAWNTVPFLFRATTNAPATVIDLQSGTLPGDLAFAVDTVSGTPDAPEGTYPVVLHAINTLGTETAATLAINLRTPAIVVLLKPHGSPLAPQPGEQWGEIVAPLGQFFQWDISAQPVGPIEVGSTITLENAPAWIALNGTSLVGTPDDSATSDVSITWSNGTFIGSTSLRVRVPTIQITSAAHLSVYEDQVFTFPLTSLPAGIFSVSEPDELPAGVGIQAGVQPNTFVLAGRTSAVGDHTFEVAVLLGDERATQSFTLSVAPLITGGDVIDGWKDEPMLEVLFFQGECTVAEWFLADAPPGVAIAEVNCPGPYAYEDGTQQVVAIAGKPTASGRYDATVIARVCCKGWPEIHRRAVTFEIGGGLYVPWLHANRLLYDLQFGVRGGLPQRAVKSFYAVPADPGETADVVKKETAPGAEVTTTTTGIKVGGKPAKILVVKRGDVVNLAIMPRDGRDVLATADGITDVALAMRLMDSPDGEYLFTLPATPVQLGDHEYFAVTLEVSSPLLTDLMGDDGLLTDPVSVVAEIRSRVNGAPLSSDTFIVQIAEDVYE